ncbi:MAG: nucleoside recognition domain-containing protein, partial [Acidimicrobiia bacterium]
SDSETTRAALAELGRHDTVLLVVQATRIDTDLAELLPLVEGKRGAIAVTFWDKVAEAPDAEQAVARLHAAVGVDLVAMDARRPGNDEKSALCRALVEARPFSARHPVEPVGWRLEPRRTLLEWPHLGPLVAVALLLAPAVVAVWTANTFAGWLDPRVTQALGPVGAWFGRLPSPLADVLAGDYGLVTMGPLLFVWALPTVVLYSLLLAAYKTSGLAERLSASVHRLVRPLGLAGRDIVRVLMGYGCNVPAVVGTRSCSGCSRDATISAIAFGAACSYQLGATTAVFAAAGSPGLVVPFLVYLTATTLVYVRLVSNPLARSRLNLLVVEGRSFLGWPRLDAVWREARFTLSSFLRKALPIFLAITVVASLVAWAGILDFGARLLQPAMAVFGLPPESALAVVLSSVRKDGLLLLAQHDLATSMSPLQLLTAVYLAGVLLPCLVTVITIARERSGRLAARIVARQAGAAVAFTLLLAWAGRAIVGG